MRDAERHSRRNRDRDRPPLLPAAAPRRQILRCYTFSQDCPARAAKADRPVSVILSLAPLRQG